MRAQLDEPPAGLDRTLLKYIQKFVRLIAINIENYQRLAQAERSLGEKDSQLILMQEMGELISSISDIDYLNEIIINMVKEVMNVHLCSVMLFETDKDGVEKHSFILLPEDDERSNRDIFTIWKEMGMLVRDKQQTIVINDPSQDDQYLGSPSASLTQPFLSAPLRVNHKVVGILHVSNKFFGEKFSASDVDLLTTLANQVSKALENARLHQNLQSSF